MCIYSFEAKAIFINIFDTIIDTESPFQLKKLKLTKGSNNFSFLAFKNSQVEFRVCAFVERLDLSMCLF